jgi:hypothetical protein
LSGRCQQAVSAPAGASRRATEASGTTAAAAPVKEKKIAVDDARERYLARRATVKAAKK